MGRIPGSFKDTLLLVITENEYERWVEIPVFAKVTGNPLVVSTIWNEGNKIKQNSCKMANTNLNFPHVVQAPSHEEYKQVGQYKY